jgi:hypothetical protein
MNSTSGTKCDKRPGVVDCTGVIGFARAKREQRAHYTGGRSETKQWQNCDRGATRVPTSTPNVLTMHPDFTVRTLADVLALARERPDKLALAPPALAARLT